MAPSETVLAEWGSITDVGQRLLLWGGRAGDGLARVEFSSEFSRQAVLEHLKEKLDEAGVTFHEVALPQGESGEEVVRALADGLRACKSGVVSISGFETAFAPDVDLVEALRRINYRREMWAQCPVRQIWWMTRRFVEQSIDAMPDLSSWFGVRLFLTESIGVERPELEFIDFPYEHVDEAITRSEKLMERFERAQSADVPPDDLLETFVIPAVEALSNIGAHQKAIDITNRVGSVVDDFLEEIDVSKNSDEVNLQVATSLNNLANLYYSQGRYEQAEPLYLEALELMQELLGDKHPFVATTLNNLAELYKSQGRYEQAEPLYLQAMELYQERLGKRHPSVASILSNLAGIYHSQGRYEQAEPLYLEALELRQELLGDKHPDVATSRNNLAELYRSQGRYEQAEPLYVQALELSKELLGGKHPDIATSLNNLAGFYKLQGRYEQAEPLYLQSLALRQELLGNQHPDIAITKNNLAELYRFQGRYEQAEPLYVQALKLLLELLGEKHPNVATIQNNLALLYCSQGRYEQAEPLYLQALKSRQKLLGNEHPDVATSQHNLNCLRLEMRIHQLISNPKFQPYLVAWNAPTETKAFMEQFNSDPQLQQNLQEFFQSLQK